VQSWCPLEPKTLTSNVVSGVDAFTVYLKVNADFPHFDETFSNLFNTTATDNGLRPQENFFSVGDMLRGARVAYNDIAAAGTIILVLIDYDCDLNNGKSSCGLSGDKFTFTRLDTDSPGYNFRYITTAPGSPNRDLVKVFGIRFFFNVFGQAGRFSFVPLMVAIGSGVGLLSVATLVCDFVLQKFLPDKDRYLAEKFQHIPEPGVAEFSAGDVLAINELSNTRHLTMNQLNTNNATNGNTGATTGTTAGSTTPYKLMRNNDIGP